MPQVSRPKVFVSRIIPEEGLAPIREACDATIWPDELPPSRDELLRSIEGCDGVLALLTDKVNDEFLDRAGPQLKVVSNFAVGFDNVDVAACTARGVAVGNTPGVLTETTADLAWALLMAAARRLVEGDRYVRGGKWRTWGASGRRSRAARRASGCGSCTTTSSGHRSPSRRSSVRRT